MTSPVAASQYQPYPGAPGYPASDYLGAPYAPPPKSRTGLIVGAVIGVLVLCLAGSIGGGLLIARAINVAASPSAQPVTNPRTSSAVQADGSATLSASAATARYLGDLRELLLPRPAGSVPWSDFADADGKLTLDETAKLFTDPSSVGKELASYGFERGAVTHWSTGKVFVLIFLFQFDT